MLLLNKKEGEEPKDSELFGYTSKYVSDELELVHDQQENIIRVSEELEKAFSEIGKIRKLLKILKKIDKTVMKKVLGEKRKQESRMINLMEDIKKLLKERRYEDIDRFMHMIHYQSKAKIRLSQEEIRKLRDVMNDLVELYKEAAGLCRLYRMVYDHIKQIYDQCEEELGTEMIEEEELSKAGSYTEHIV